MSDVQSNLSYSMSAIQFNSASLNPLDSIHPSVINKIKREADSFMGSSQKCLKLWKAIAKNEIAGQYMNQNVLQVIFKEFKADLYLLTKISSLRQFMRIFDQDRDGSLNPDEQIQIFSYIKQKIEVVANNCSQIQLYIKFEALMKEVRILEGYIVKWQNQLRARIHLQQLQRYKQEGFNRIDEFCDHYDREFEELRNLMISKREKFEKQAFYESQALEEKLSRPEQFMKIKPKNKLKELQVQQKLVSLEERVYQALDFRRQLNEIEVQEKNRVDKLMTEYAEHERENLRKKQSKQRKQLEIKLEEVENKLIIRMKRDFEILKKKNNLHEIEILRLQGLEKKYAMKKGTFEPELKRTKKLQKQRNQVIEEYKKSMFKASSTMQQEQDDAKEVEKTKMNAETLMNQTVKFNISRSNPSGAVLNKMTFKTENNSAAKIQKLIGKTNNERNYSLANMYNDDLQEVVVNPVINQELKKKERERKFNFVMGKLSN